GGARKWMCGRNCALASQGMVTRPESQGAPMISEASRKMAKLNAHGCAMAAPNWLTTLATPGASKVCACNACGRSVLGTMRKPVGGSLGRKRAASLCDLLYSAAAVGAAGRACHRHAESAK